jgi:His/Glu/Gln/Arg/opine family amino acid ABC transporter permease subunit
MLLGFALNGLCGRRGLAFRLWRVYVWAVRGTPFLAQLAVIYFGLPSLGIMLSAVDATLLSLTLYSAAYFGEIFAPRGTASRRDSAKRRWPTTSLRSLFLAYPDTAGRSFCATAVGQSVHSDD